MQNLNTRPATRKVGQSTEIVKLLRIQASDTHVVEFDNVDTRFNDCNNWQVMAGGNVSCSATACMSVFQM
ncbi:hypothetical protein ACKU3T_023700 [Enterobacter hormaechei]